MVDAVLDATCDGVLVSDFYAAERSLRHLVTCRKISGSTCSDQGTQTKLTLSSFFGTLALQRLDPLDQSRRLLAAPQL